MRAGAAVSQVAKVLESGVPLSRSLIWRLQRDFYTRRSLKAWTEDNVPSFITNNPFIAEVYAGIVAAFVGDCMGDGQQAVHALSPQNPLRILELGAGTGKFAYLFLLKLTSLLQERHIAPEIVRYRMTDCSPDLLSVWKGNPYLARFTASGILEFELLQAGEENSSQSTTGSGAGQAKMSGGPLVVIANYVFDSLAQDAFVIRDDKIEEALVTTATTGADDGNPPLPGSLQLSFNNVAVPPQRYADRIWNSILEHYRGSLPTATIFFPTAALNLLQQLAGSSDGRMLVLAADKGLTREENLAFRQGPPELEFHASGQCFSSVVNFDAMARYYWSIGSEAFLPQKHFSNLNICAFLQHQPEQEFPATRKAYSDAADAFGLDDLFTLMDWLDSRMNDVSIAQALAILRLTRWDTTALLRLFPVIGAKLRYAVAERDDLHDAVLKTLGNQYPVSAADNALVFNCGVIFLELRFFREALELFKTSERVLGRSAATSYNLGLCAASLGRAGEALAYMVDACAQDPLFAPAQSARARLESESKPG